ncbi:Contig13544.g14453 [Symbiodinium natans]|uniref:Contig13544.g14453 protein n=1 Tax=Symbiodinium natans TaxID=878477 RepID=A0A812MDM9_9DINO|nr:Contig13544.g14453 [Symbiodinium natans]
MSAVGEIPILGHLLKYFVEDLTTTFTWRQDVGLPPGHIKAIHPIGSVAVVQLAWFEDAIQEAGYTGLFTADGMAPGAALKVFRDNEESVNSFMLYSLRGQKPVLQGFEVIIGLLRLWCAAGFLQVECAVRKGFSQFEHMLCNKLSDFRDKGFAEKLLLKSFETASKYPFTTGLSQWAEGPGLLPEHTKFPFVLCLRPTDIIREHFEEFKHEKFEHIQEQLGFLCLGLTPALSDLYEIWAAPEPKTNLTKIGMVSLRTEFRKTKFGDTELFFRHDRFENDLMIREDWKPIVDDPDFWFDEGANNRYSDVDPGEKDSGLGQNAWAGGYNPAGVSEMMNDAQHTGGSLLETGSRPRCPFAYLHQGESSIVHSLLSK